MDGGVGGCVAELIWWSSFCNCRITIVGDSVLPRRNCALALGSPNGNGFLGYAYDPGDFGPWMVGTDKKGCVGALWWFAVTWFGWLCFLTRDSVVFRPCKLQRIIDVLKNEIHGMTLIVLWHDN